MKSSKIENIFDYNPPLEETETISSLAYYQPFQSSFNLEFPVPQQKTAARPKPLLMKKWNAGTERSPVNLGVSGGGTFGFWNLRNGGFSPRSSTQSSPAFATASTSWGEQEARSLCNSTWRSPGPSRFSFSTYEESQSSNRLMPGAEASSICSPFLGNREPSNNLFDLGFRNLNKPSFRTGASFGQSLEQAPSFDGSFSSSTYYPLMLRPLTRNISPNVTGKTGLGRPMVCNFCKNNKEVPDIYLNHYLYDPETKVLSCPVLRKHVCEICGGTGDQAHTLQYCPVNKERGLQSKVPVLLKTRTITNSTGKIRRN